MTQPPRALVQAPSMRRRGAVLVLLACLAAPFAPSGGSVGDGALTWDLDQGPKAGAVDAIAGTSVAWLAVTRDGHVLRSIDAGDAWALVDGAPVVTKPRLVFDTQMRGYLAGVGGVWRTLDAGATWTQVLAVSRAARIDVAADGMLAVGARFGDATNDVLVSADHGTTWQHLGAPIPDGEPICGVAFGRSTQEILTMTDQQSWFSHDGGASWTETPGKGLDFVIEADRSVWRLDMNVIERTTDGGATWQPVVVPGVVTTGTPHHGGGVILAANTGLLVTRDGGTSWSGLGFGNQVFDATSLRHDPDNDRVLVTDARVGIAEVYDIHSTPAYRGHDAPLAPAAVQAVAAAGTTIAAAGPAGGFLSLDGGTTWRHTGVGVRGVTDVRTASLSRDGHTVWFGASDIVGRPVVGVSHDGGRFFATRTLPVTSGFIAALAVDPEDPFRAAAAVTAPDLVHPVLSTDDGGVQWRVVTEGVTPLPALDLAWHRNAGLLATTPGGVWVVQGDAWVPLGAQGAVRLGAAHLDVVAMGQGVLWRSTGSLVPVLAPELVAAPEDVSDVLLEPDGMVWAAAAQGVWRCAPGGEACTSVGLGGHDVQGIALTERAWAATQSGLWSAAR